MRKCGSCGKLKQETEFPRVISRGISYLRRRCWLCHRKIRNKEYNLYRFKNLDKHRDNDRKWYRKLKIDAFSAYGGAICSWCHEDDVDCLVIDHINNDGAEHRRNFKGPMYQWLKRNKYPPGFQVLCANCNQAKSTNNGILPLNRKNKYL